jgi:hypothetical protein
MNLRSSRETLFFSKVNLNSLTLTGKKRRDTVCIALVAEESDDLDNTKIRMNKVVRKNLAVRLGGKLFQSLTLKT